MYPGSLTWYSQATFVQGRAGKTTSWSGHLSVKSLLDFPAISSTWS